jgi:2',3'-cyclic-nucleotide 2'-phosphodiesterase (5'-nucleotidase family)
MKQKAYDDGKDLLLIDSGDLHDGNGLTDGYPAGEVDAHEANKLVAKVPYDVMAIGKYVRIFLEFEFGFMNDVLQNSHELYNYTYTKDMHDHFKPLMKGRYLSSNVNITINGETMPVGG